MIPDELPVIANSLWTHTAHPDPDRPALAGSETADVAIVGGGFTGLSAALHLVEAGVDVALLEAHQPGWGASGRNGGQVNPGLKDTPEAIVRAFGPEMGERMNALSGGAGDLVFDLIERHGIRCDAIRPGWIRAAHTARHMEDLVALARAWQARGVPFEILDGPEMARLTGTEGYVGGVLDPRGGNLHPLNYALGLAQAAEARGARIFGASPVTAIEPSASGYSLVTAQGRLDAAKVLLCTNAYSGRLQPDLARSVLPVRSVQVATAPLSDNLRATVLPEKHAVSDTRRLLLYFRLDAEGRFVIGGRGTFRDTSTQTQMERLKAVAARLYPQLADVAWEHAWGGNVALTLDHTPHLNEIAPGMAAGLGYNGRGVAMGTAMGRQLALWAQGVLAQDLDFPVTPLRPIPGHFARNAAIPAEILRLRLLDALGL